MVILYFCLMTGVIKFWFIENMDKMLWVIAKNVPIYKIGPAVWTTGNFTEQDIIQNPLLWTPGLLKQLCLWKIREAAELSLYYGYVRKWNLLYKFVWLEAQLEGMKKGLDEFLT